MNDYEKDMTRWFNTSESADLNGCNPKPNISDYDKYGNKPGTKYTSDGRAIDPYLVELYGMDYAIANAH